MQLALWHGSAQGWAWVGRCPVSCALGHPPSSPAAQLGGTAKRRPGGLRTASDRQQSSAEGGSAVHKVFHRGCKGDSELCEVDPGFQGIRLGNRSQILCKRRAERKLSELA